MLKDNQYFKDKQFKNQIVIHHTAGSGKAENVIHGWDFNVERVGTAYVIDASGLVVKAFEPEYWAYHLGLKSIQNSQLNKNSIGIEICNWGQLVKKTDGKYYNYINGIVPDNEVVQMPKFRGFEYYHKYNDAQIESVRKLILELAAKFAIPLDYNSDMWDISQNALSGKKGIYTHVSYRTDKNDCSPQFNLIEMLKNLKK
jgi:N-acetyl-anhydromuramyl-L-alanine amidase AmpD